MHLNLLYSAAVAVAAVILNVGLVTPTQAQAKAALTRDIDRPSAQPVNGYCGSKTPDYNYTAIKCNLYTVPSGKRLIVETVSYQAFSVIGSYVADIFFGQDSPGTVGGMDMASGNVFRLQPVPRQDNGATSLRVYGSSQPLSISIDETKTLAAGGSYVGAFVGITWQFAFSGYLVDK